MGHFVPSPTTSQKSMIESMIKPVGDNLWQRGANCGGVSCPGGTSCSAASKIIRGYVIVAYDFTAFLYQSL